MIQDYTIEQYSELGKNGMDKDNTDVLVKKVQEVALHTVKNTEGSRGVYMRVWLYIILENVYNKRIGNTGKR